MKKSVRLKSLKKIEQSIRAYEAGRISVQEQLDTSWLYGSCFRQSGFLKFLYRYTKGVDDVNCISSKRMARIRNEVYLTFRLYHAAIGDDILHSDGSIMEFFHEVYLGSSRRRANYERCSGDHKRVIMELIEQLDEEKVSFYGGIR